MEKKTHTVKINRVPVVDQVCESIKNNIISGVWTVGDKLPSEESLADQFGVNRLSVRMALQKLSALGFVETRVGDGTYVQDFSLRPVMDEIFLLYGKTEKYKEIQQLRECLEGTSIRIATEHSIPENLARLKEALDAYDTKIKQYREDRGNPQKLEALIDADLAFHCAIIAASGNSLIQDIYYMVQKVIRSHISKLISIRIQEMSTKAIEQTDTHHKIYDGIVAGDYQLAIKASQEILGVIPLEGVEDEEPLLR